MFVHQCTFPDSVLAHIGPLVAKKIITFLLLRIFFRLWICQTPLPLIACDILIYKAKEEIAMGGGQALAHCQGET